MQYMLPDTSTTGPNYLALKFLPTDPNDGSTVVRLSGGLLETYQDQFSQEDVEATSEWIWVYIHFIVDPNTLAVTAVGSDTGNSACRSAILVRRSRIWIWRKLLGHVGILQGLLSIPLL
jgi:hypothetical protein